MTEKRFNPGEQHPEEWSNDLNPNAHAGVNDGTRSQDEELSFRSAYDHKEAHAVLRDFNDQELKDIPVLAEGARLQQGATYLDLYNLERGEFTAMGGMEAGHNNLFVPKDRVPYETWNKLLGR